MNEPPESPLHSPLYAALEIALHDFRSGIVSMAAVLKMLQFRVQRMPEGDDRAGALQEIELVVGAAARLEQLVGRLHPLVRHAEVTTQIARHDMTQLIREAVGVAPASEVRLRLPDGRVDACVDGARVVALLRELLAAVASTSQAVVTLELHRGEGTATIAITWRAGTRRPERDLRLLVAAALAEQLGATWRLEPASDDELTALIECKL
jgi:hypothetical protein